MKELNQFCKMFVVGSDQLFNDGLYNNFGRWCTLDWVQDNKRKSPMQLRSVMIISRSGRNPCRNGTFYAAVRCFLRSGTEWC